jgi:hypothetical protein
MLSARLPPFRGVRVKSLVIASVLVAACAGLATAAAGARKPPSPPANPPIVKDGVEISILPHVGAGGSAGSVTEVGLDLEAKTADAAARFGFQSLRAVADVDCSRSANRFLSAIAYQQPSLAGAGQPRNITGEWVQPASDSYMAVVIARVCATEAAAAPAEHAPPVVKEMAAAPPPAPPAQTPSPQAAAGASPAAAAPSAAAAPAPAPTPPQVVKFSGGRPVAPRPEAAAAPRSSAPPPSAPAPSGPLVVKFNGGSPAAPAAAAAPRRAGDRVAQVAASADARDAERVLRELKPLITAPLTTSIEQAVVGGAHVYRADVIGFASAADAKAFCKSAAHVSKTCWVRARNDAPAKSAKPAERLRPAKRPG